MIPYDSLDKAFIAPKRISPFFDESVKLPRKVKKQAKKFCGVHWDNLSNAQRLWYYMEVWKPDYKRFIIKQISNI